MSLPNLPSLPSQLTKFGFLSERNIAQSIKLTVGSTAARARPMGLGRTPSGSGFATHWLFTTGFGQPVAIARIYPSATPGTFDVELARLTTQAVTVVIGTTTYNFAAVDPATQSGIVQGGYLFFTATG